jgi:hypothetical protein
MLALPEIDPVEKLMVTVGLRALISREVERFKKSDLKTANDLPKTISKLASDMVNGTLEAAGNSDFDYKSMLKDLARGWEPEQVVEMMAAFPPDLAVYSTALVLKAKAVIEGLEHDYPQTNYVTATGSINLVPADKKIFKFVQVLEALCDPLQVFALMAAGALLQTQVKAVRLVFPKLSQAIDAAILQATLKAKAAKKSFELEPLAEIGVRAWFGKGPIPTDSLKKAQAAVDRSQQRNDARQAPPTSSNVSRDQQTLSQRVESA